MARTIRVDDEVYAWLQGQARAFEDTPNSVLRRVAAFDPPQPTAASKTLGETSMRPTWQLGEKPMSTQKFDEADRERTIEAIEQRLGINLSKAGSGRKLLEDETGTPYLILGGYGDWHGIPKKMMEDAGNGHAAGKLIIAKHTGPKIKIYSASLRALFQSAEALTVNENGDRQFNLGWEGDRPFIKKAPDIRLELLTEID